MDASFLKEMAGLFLDEVDEQLDTISQEILKLENNGDSEQAIQSLFRAAHTLKGSSAAMGFEEMKQLTHEMEHVLDLVRRNDLKVTNKLINLLFSCLDHLSMLKEEFIINSGITIEISTIVNELQSFANHKEDPAIEQSFQSENVISLLKENLEASIKVQAAQEQGLRIHDIHVMLTADCLMKSVRAWMILNQLEAIGDVLYTVPSIEDLNNEETTTHCLNFLLAGQIEPAEIKDILQSIMDVAEVRVAHFTPPHTPQYVENTSIEIEKIDQPKRTEKPKVSEDGKRKAQTIRVDVERLELLMNLVGELVIDQTRISRVGNILHHRYTSDENVDELGQISDHVSRVVSELQESVMKVRMLPIEQLFNRFPRMVRDLAQTLNKDINLTIEGTETELDRTVIEEIGDPLIHLIRNAVDHGMESPEERIQKGKPAQGELRITAAHEENQVVITVEDNGAGINPEKIKDSALRKGIITEEEYKRLSDQESIYLIFRPGFSTASTVSDISGRGVGMDIVKNHIEKLNGVIDIETKLGEGTKFKIKLPLTLAIITGLLIKLNGRTYILPMSSVVEIVRMPPEQIQTIKGDSVVVIRDRVIPVVWLHDYFQIPRMQQKRKQQPIVVVGTAEKRIALVVDELIGNQEIVVKSLGSYVGKAEAVSGATILGDGRVALILEVAGIVRMTNRI